MCVVHLWRGRKVLRTYRELLIISELEVGMCLLSALGAGVNFYYFLCQCIVSFSFFFIFFEALVFFLPKKNSYFAV